VASIKHMNTIISILLFLLVWGIQDAEAHSLEKSYPEGSRTKIIVEEISNLNKTNQAKEDAILNLLEQERLIIRQELAEDEAETDILNQKRTTFRGKKDELDKRVITNPSNYDEALEAEVPRLSHTSEPNIMWNLAWLILSLGLSCGTCYFIYELVSKNTKAPGVNSSVPNVRTPQTTINPSSSKPHSNALALRRPHPPMVPPTIISTSFGSVSTKGNQQRNATIPNPPMEEYEGDEGEFSDESNDSDEDGTSSP